MKTQAAKPLPIIHAGAMAARTTRSLVMKPFFRLAPLSLVLMLLALLAGCPDTTRPSPITPKVPQPTTPKIPQPKAQTGDAPGSDSINPANRP